MTSLQLMYSAACKAYVEKLNEMWETDGEWTGDGYRTFDVVDLFLSNWELRYVVDNGIDFDSFLKWYDYDMQMLYGIALGKKKARRINIDHWFEGFPEEAKVPKAERERWERDYFNGIK